MDGDQFHESKTPFGESPAETIGFNTTVPTVPSSEAEDIGSYHEITGPSLDHGGPLDLDADGHASLMTAALLEFYCKSRALEILNSRKGSHGAFTQNSPEVQALGKRLYEYKSRFLSSHGVIANGIDGNDWDSARQYYRDSLDTLGLTALESLQLDPTEPRSPKNGVASGPSGPSKTASRQLGGMGLQRRITDRENVPPVLEGPSNFTSLLRLPHPTPASIPLLRQPSSPTIPQSSRYSSEFTEIRLLGKGSFGSVYHVTNHVDGQNYAVKKIPISGRRLRQFQDGLRDLENLLKEIRTLARLDHLNIVRYFGAWVEHSASSGDPISGGVQAESLRRPLLSHDPATEDESEAGVVFEEDTGGIVFEASSHPADGTGRSSSRSTLASPSRPRKSRSLGNGEDDDEDVESIPRQFSIPSQDPTTTVSGTDQDIFTDDMGENMSNNMQVGRRNQGNMSDPVITLHIQMSLHPISLATYLSPLAQSGHGSGKQNLPRHCYHVVPSLKLILGVLSGVEYLHAKGIVHRDLKPGNIFLSPCEIHTTHVCPSCNHATTDVSQYTIPRIGDFGLVAEISEYGEQPQGATHLTSHASQHPRPHDQRVGTEFYRPPLFTPPPHDDDQERPIPDDEAVARNQKHRSDSASYVNEKLDIFALGVILFELLYKLDTRMERQLVLFDLTRAPNANPKNPSGKVTSTTFPADFKKKVDDSAIPMSSSVLDSLVTCIQGMLDPDPERRWSCKAVRACLEQVLSRSEPNSPTDAMGL